jgi:hypothetical protein
MRLTHNAVHRFVHSAAFMVSPQAARPLCLSSGFVMTWVARKKFTLLRHACTDCWGMKTEEMFLKRGKLATLIFYATGLRQE